MVKKAACEKLVLFPSWGIMGELIY